MPMSREQRLNRLQRIFDVALNNNPLERPFMATPPTITLTAATDGTLPAGTSVANGSALSSFAQNQIAWYGGNPVIQASAYARVETIGISTPNTSGNAGGGSNQWCTSLEFMSDAPKVELCMFMSNIKQCRVQVDGQYDSGTVYTGAGAGAADNFLLLDFAGVRAPRRIRILNGANSSAGMNLIKSIKKSANCDIWKPSQHDVIHAAWVGDSYVEGQTGGNTVQPVANGNFVYRASERLGIRDPRQFGVGQTGYVASGPLGLVPAINQIPYWRVPAEGIDMFVGCYGYNDASNTFDTIRQAVRSYYQRIRSLYPTAPIFVLGCQAGAGGPNASQITCENAIKQGVADLKYRDIRFIPVSTDPVPWLSTNNSGTLVDGDLTHPSLTGHDVLSFRAAFGIRSALQDMINN